jgi:hypothetical protein
VDHAGNVCLCYSHDHAFRHSGDCRQAQRLSGQAPFPNEIAGSQKCDHGFLPVLGEDGRLDLAALNVENRIRRFALRVDNLILPIIGNDSPPRSLSIERLWDQTRSCFPLPQDPPLADDGTARPPGGRTGF